MQDLEVIIIRMSYTCIIRHLLANILYILVCIYKYFLMSYIYFFIFLFILFYFFWWMVFTSSPGLCRVMLGAEGGGPGPRRSEIADRPQRIGQMLDLLIIWFIMDCI